MTLSDEWFSDYLRRARLGHKMQRVISERPTLTEDAWRKASYDAETDALLAIIRTDHGRGRGARGSIPDGSQGAARRLLATVGTSC